MNIQKIIDVLGYINLVGLLVWIGLTGLFYEQIIICFGGLLLIPTSFVRIILFLKTPKNERRVYRNMDIFYGWGTLVHPYSQSAIIIFIAAAASLEGIRLI